MRYIFIDPPYDAYNQDRLFDETNAALNRDDTLEPNIRLKESLEGNGHQVHTADYLIAQKESLPDAEYYSFGLLSNYAKLTNLKNIRMRAFVIFEPPVVAPDLYKALPELTKVFEKVYVHNIEGDGYALKGVDVSRLRKFYWPQPKKNVIEKVWNNSKRKDQVVVINGNHKPQNSNKELYSKRIEIIAELSKAQYVDLYGRGWERWWSRSSFWLPYWKNKNKIMSVYKGECQSKFDILGNYKFSLCFENMEMKGYVTEKIFDCLYSGTIPIYLGAQNIQDYFPENIYIDFRKYDSTIKLIEYLHNITDQEIEQKRKEAREWIESENYNKYYDSLIDIFK